MATDDGWKLPTEMSPEEFADLQSQIVDLSEAEAQEEWMESCRYGEVDIVRALLCRHPRLVDHIHEESGNTGLHFASANGHLEVVKLLLKHNHPIMVKNKAGNNTPLHWAAERGQEAIVQLLTEQKTESVDVLAKNQFGRSALTEGFTSQNTNVVKSLLEHESASEDKLLNTGTKEDASSSPPSQEVTHDFFGYTQQQDDDTTESTPSKSLLVRELAITNADNPFADTENPDNDTTGLSIWAASLILARWMRTKSELWKDSLVLELGAGCGVPGLAVAQSNPPPKHVYITDLNPRAVDNIQHNISINNLEQVATTQRMDWSDTGTFPQVETKFDYIVGSDLVYQKAIVPLLMDVLMKILRPGGSFFYVAPKSGRDGLSEFIKKMKKKDGCRLKEIPATGNMISNPLTNQDDEECFLHFNELSSLEFVLYEFQIPS